MARTTSPLASQVVSLTRFNTGGNAYNVIPDTVKLGATYRSLTHEGMLKMQTSFQEVLRLLMAPCTSDCAQLAGRLSPQHGSTCRYVAMYMCRCRDVDMCRCAACQSVICTCRGSKHASQVHTALALALAQAQAPPAPALSWHSRGTS